MNIEVQKRTSQDDERTVLLIEDNPADARMMQLLLGEVESTNFHVDWCDRLEQG